MTPHSLMWRFRFSSSMAFMLLLSLACPVHAEDDAFVKFFEEDFENMWNNTMDDGQDYSWFMPVVIASGSVLVLWIIAGCFACCRYKNWHDAQGRTEKGCGWYTCCILGGPFFCAWACCQDYKSPSEQKEITSRQMKAAEVLAQKKKAAEERKAAAEQKILEEAEAKKRRKEEKARRKAEKAKAAAAAEAYRLAELEAQRREQEELEAAQAAEAEEENVHFSSLFEQDPLEDFQGFCDQALLVGQSLTDRAISGISGEEPMDTETTVFVGVISTLALVILVKLYRCCFGASKSETPGKPKIVKKPPTPALRKPAPKAKKSPRKDHLKVEPQLSQGAVSVSEMGVQFRRQGSEYFTPGQSQQSLTVSKDAKSLQPIANIPSSQDMQSEFVRLAEKTFGKALAEATSAMLNSSQDPRRSSRQPKQAQFVDPSDYTDADESSAYQV